jgi:hypothetical protein
MKKETNRIPVFFHIPKNSGTYITNCILISVREKYKNIRLIKILDGEFVLAKIIVSLNDKSSAFPDGIIWNLDIKDFTHDFLEELSIIAIIIEARGFRRIDLLSSLFAKKISEFDLYKFIILREPFSREQSLYHYLTSNKSKHETTHGVFKSLSFEEHLLSKQLQDSWLIRSLLDLPNGGKLTQDHFDKAILFLQDFNVYSAKNTDEAVEDVLLKCFNIQDFDKESFADRKHDNIYKKIKFEELPSDVQIKFNERKYWDQKLYDFFIE